MSRVIWRSGSLTKAALCDGRVIVTFLTYTDFSRKRNVPGRFREPAKGQFALCATPSLNAWRLFARKSPACCAGVRPGRISGFPSTTRARKPRWSYRPLKRGDAYAALSETKPADADYDRVSKVFPQFAAHAFSERNGRRIRTHNSFQFRK